MLGKGLSPSGWPIQEGRRLGQGRQLGSELLHLFCKYSPKNAIVIIKNGVKRLFWLTLKKGFALLIFIWKKKRLPVLNGNLSDN